ncbi:MAG: hypothetical protein P4L87_13980 [Formivibrio sp.]|nr:hypothetical protein [Formivibrio sp.]
MFIHNIVLKKALSVIVGGVLLAITSGCVIAPAPYPATGYVEPYYASPGVGWVWEFQPDFGWGWHHPQHGWYRDGHDEYRHGGGRH